MWGIHSNNEPIIAIKILLKGKKTAYDIDKINYPHETLSTRKWINIIC